MVLVPDKLLATLLAVNGLREFQGLGTLGGGGCRIRPKPPLESPWTGALTRIRPASRRRMDTGKEVTGGHGGVAVIARLRDSTTHGGGQAGS